MQLVGFSRGFELHCHENAASAASSISSQRHQQLTASATNGTCSYQL